MVKVATVYGKSPSPDYGVTALSVDGAHENSLRSGESVREVILKLGRFRRSRSGRSSRVFATVVVPSAGLRLRRRRSPATTCWWHSRSTSATGEVVSDSTKAGWRRGATATDDIPFSRRAVAGPSKSQSIKKG